MWDESGVDGVRLLIPLVFISVGIAVGIGVDSGSAGGLALPDNQRPQPVGRTLRVSRLFLYPAMTECLSPTTADPDPTPIFTRLPRENPWWARRLGG